MPNPNSYKDRKSFMKVCVPMVVKEGTAKNNKQAVAICFSMWSKKGKKSKGQELLNNMGQELKKKKEKP